MIFTLGTNLFTNSRSCPLCTDWWKSDSSVDREPQGNSRWNSNSRDVVAGKTFSKKETFGVFPLQVQGYSDLHDSLEGAMAQVEIEPVGSEGTHKSGQEVQLIQRLDQT